MGTWKWRRLGARMILCAALAAFVLTATHDGAPGAATAQDTPPNDMFEQRDYWYPQESGGFDTFPLDRQFATNGATLEPGETAACAPIGATVWSSWWGDRGGTLTIDTGSSSFATVIAIYEFDYSGDFLPSPPGGHLRPLACAGDGAGPASLSYDVLPDHEYIIQIGGYDGAGGDLRVHAECACAPPTDTFINGVRGELYVDGYQQVARGGGSTTRATTEPGEPAPCGAVGATVWYSLYAYNATGLRITTDGSDFDTVLAVYRAPYYTSSFAELALVDCADDIGSQETIALAGDPNVTYYIQAGGAAGATGNLQLQVECVPACPPYNDNQGSSEYWEVPVQGATANTEGATLEAGEPRPCGDVGHTIWYHVVSHGDAHLIVDTGGSDFPTVVAAYAIEGFSPPPNGYRNVGCDAGEGARIEFDAEANLGYWLQVGGVGGAFGTTVLNVSCEPVPCPPWNDSLGQPWGFSTYGDYHQEMISDTRGATLEDGEDTSCGDMAKTVWYSTELWDTQSARTVLLDTGNTNFDTAIALYEGPRGYPPPSLDLLRRISCDPGGPGLRAAASFELRPGMAVYIQVGGVAGASGDLNLGVRCEGPCPPENDNIAGAWYAGDNYFHAADTRGASLEADEPTACGNMGKTVWFGLYPPLDLPFTVETEQSDFNAAIAVYEVEGVSPPGVLREIVCSTTGDLEFTPRTGIGYLIQIGGVDGAGGALAAGFDCAECPDDYYYGGGRGGGGPIPAVDTGGFAQGTGALAGPDTGSGGYLPGARQD